ncbi:MAG: ATP-binding protein, partial [Acidobacteriota bacterium]
GSYNSGVRWRSYLLAGLTVGALVGALRLVSVEAAGIAAPLLLLDVVVVARFAGTGPALFAAALGAASYSYYFLPPAGFAIADPEDWIEFITFIVTAVVAGELASRAERRTAEAQAGRLEIERLYQELHAAFDRAAEVEAERRNEQLKAALLEAVTHNLRTPLTSIKAAVTALIGAGQWSRTAEISSEGRGELLEVIDEESDRLNRLIEGLSTSDRVDRAELLPLRAVPVETIVRTAIHRAGTVTRAHRVNLVLDAGLPSLSVDAPSASEVLYILLDNASKYSPAGSTIVIRATKRDDERYVRLTVSDEGPGIPEELSERVFEKFFRVPGREPYDRRRGGVGLGLLIARRLVEAQGGRIWVEASGAVRGTTVALMLPVAVEE